MYIYGFEYSIERSKLPNGIYINLNEQSAHYRWVPLKQEFLGA